MARRKDVQLLQQSIERTVRMLARKRIPVYQTGSKAFVAYHPETLEPMSVTIPVITDEATDLFINAIQGFIDHEVAHVLYSDASVIAEGVYKKMRYHNGVEDCMIEAMSIEEFPGAKINLRRTRQMIIEQIMPEFVAKAEASPELLTRWNFLCVAAFRAWAGQDQWIDFMSDKWHLIQEVVDKLPKIIPNFLNIRSSQMALDLARDIQYKLYGDPTKPMSKPKPPEKDEDEDDGEEGEPGEPGEPSEPGDEGEPEEGESEESESGDEAKPSKSGKSSKSDEEEESEDEAGDESEEGESSDAGKQDDSDAEPEQGDEHEVESDGEGEQKCGEEEFEERPLFDGEPLPELKDDDELAKLLSALAKEEHGHIKYVPYTRRWDKIEPPKFEDTKRLRQKMEEMQDNVDAVTGGLRRHLARMFVAMNRDRYEAGKKAGRLSNRDLYRLKTGDARVFKTKEITRSKETAVSLLVDCSGSMSGHKIEVAMQAAWAMGDCLHKIGIPFEILGFTTSFGGGSYEEKNDYDEGRRAGGYVRFESLYIPIFKAFEEKYCTESKLRMSRQTHGHMSQNVDGESVQYAGERLLRQPQDNKVMIVLSDGMPASSTVSGTVLNKHLKDTVEKFEKTGMKIIGIGINTTAVKQFYKKSVVINNVSELPGAVIKQIGDLVLAR